MRARGFAIGGVSSREKPTASRYSSERVTTSNEESFGQRAISIDKMYNEKQIEMQNSRDDDFKR